MAASLACPWCLSWQIDWVLHENDYDARATCACGECGRRREVFLTPEQALRLSLEAGAPLDTRPRTSDLLLAF